MATPDPTPPPTMVPKPISQPEGNPALRAMGLPRLRAKLPSRNWTIFLTLTSSFLGTVAYDRYQTKLIKRKWTSLVAPLASEPLPTTTLPRRVTVYLAAPPGDGINPAREHFRDYVKPILNAAAVDFEVVEGRSMGELRAKVAEEVRVRRRGQEGVGDPVEEVRRAQGVERAEEGGVLILGRHAWKEYVRGLHEGWLGPLEAPVKPLEAPTIESVEKFVNDFMSEDNAAPTDTPTTPATDGSSELLPEPEKEKPKPVDEPEKPKFAPELITPEQYASAASPDDLPAHLPATGIIPFQHLLGFLNTPTRMYRFVTRRYLAEKVCREAAAVALGTTRVFVRTPEPEGTMITDIDVEKALQAPEHVLGEIDALREEEKDWTGRVWKEERYKGPWTEDVTVDERLGSRMLKYWVPRDKEPMPIETTVWKELFGGLFRKKEVKGVILGNIDDEDA